MRSKIALMLLIALAAVSAGLAQAQDAANATNVTEVLNDTNISAAAQAVAAAVVVPVAEAAVSVVENASEEVAEAPVPAISAAAPADSRFKQLSVFAGGSTVLGKSIAAGYTDVSATTDRKAVFTRDAGELSPSTKLGISKVGIGDDKYVEVASKAVGEWDLTGWSLSSAGSTTFTFPSMILEAGAAVRIHQGAGDASATDIYTNSSEPLWIDSLVSLQDAEGDVVSTFDISAQPTETKWVDPLRSQIQY